MAEYTVVNASKKKELEGQNGPMQVIALTLSQNGDAGTVNAEWFTKAATPLPQQGSKLEGDLEDSPYGKKFKKARQGFGGKRDPATEKRIVHQHSQDMAIETLKLAQLLGVAPPVEDVKGIVDAVETLANVYDRKAWEAA